MAKGGNNLSPVEHLDQHWQHLRIPGTEGVFDTYVEPREVILSHSPDYARSVARHVLHACEGQVASVLGTAEASVILSVSGPRVSELRHQGILPEPFQELAATPLWNAADVIVCAITRKRSRGPEVQTKNLI